MGQINISQQKTPKIFSGTLSCMKLLKRKKKILQNQIHQQQYCSIVRSLITCAKHTVVGN